MFFIIGHDYVNSCGVWAFKDYCRHSNFWEFSENKIVIYVGF